MKNNVFLKSLFFASLVCMVGSSNAQTNSEETSTISRTFYNNDGTPLEGVRVTVTKVVKNGRIISLGPVTYVSNASGVVSIKIPQGSTVYMETPEFNNPGGVPVNISSPSGWTYTYDSLQPLSTMSAAGLIVQSNDITVGMTPKDTLDFSTTFNVSASPASEANVSINHDSLKGRAGSKLTYLHNLFVDRGLSAHDESSLANAHTKALDSNFVLIVPPDYPASTMTFSASDASLKLINYDTLNITENQTVPKGASIVMAGTGVFNISSGITLTFANGSRFDGGLQRRFIGSGTVKFNENVVNEIYPQWFGAVGDSSTNSTTAFNTALTSRVSGKRLRVVVPSGIYIVNSHILVPSNTEFIGNNATIINTVDTLANGVIRGGTLNPVVPVKNIKISGFTIKTVPTSVAHDKPNRFAIAAHECDTLEISNNRILNASGMGMAVISCKNVKIIRNHVENANRDGIHVVNGDAIDRGRTVWSENVIIQENTVKNCGDANIACISYQRPQAVGSPGWNDSTWVSNSQLINRNVSIVGNIVEGSRFTYSTTVGLDIRGVNRCTVMGNTVRGAANGRMLQGIYVDRGTSQDGFGSTNVVVSGNIITGGQYTSLIQSDSSSNAENSGIRIGAADSVTVSNNIIRWSKYANGIFFRALSTDAAYYRNTSRNVKLIGNQIADALIGIKMVSDPAAGFFENTSIVGNDITDCQRFFINADSVAGLFVNGNTFSGCALDTAFVDTSGGVSGIRLNNIRRDVVISNNIFRSDTDPDQYVIVINKPDTSGTSNTCNLLVRDNTYSISPGLGLFSFPNADRPYYLALERNVRVHHAGAVPTDGIWRKGDRVVNHDPDRGEQREWINIANGNPGTWVAGLVEVSGLNFGEEKNFTLATNGTISGGINGYSNIRLDTFGEATLDSVGTSGAMAGRLGQIVTVRSRVNSRDIVFRDSGEFSGLKQQRVLQDTLDALTLLRVPGAVWQEIGWSGSSDSNPMLIASVAGVNMNSATATTLYTVPTGKSCIVTHVVVRNASTSLTTASYSFGFNSANFNNVIANATHTELTGNTVYTVLNAMAGATRGAAGGTFKVLMNTLQGSAATTTMDVYGYLYQQ